MKGQSAKQPITNKKSPPQEEQKPWKAEDYVTQNVSLEEVRDVKGAFDIFDSDGSGYVDAGELRQAFISLGLANANKLVYNIMHSLDGDHPKGLNFGDFLRLATGRLGETQTRKQI